MTPVIETRSLVKHFTVTGGFFGRRPKRLTTVDHASLMVRRGETIGLVGESGCGKSTVGNCILRLIRANGGQFLYNGQNILTLSENDFHKLRGKLKVVLLDPQASLDPRMTVQTIVGYPIGFNRVSRVNLSRPRDAGTGG